MSQILDLQHVRKIYGNRVALEDVSFTVKTGSCFGLLGPNGAGKSTTMKIITGIIAADQGDVKVFDLDAKKQVRTVQTQIGYVPQSITLYEELSAIENLTFFGKLLGVHGAELKSRIEEVLKQTGLSDRGNDEVSTYSGGMKRRINIAAALLHRPKLLVLDEPTVGIDPQSRNLIFELIRLLNRQGITIIYSTHYMEEVEALCDEIAIMDHGNVIAKGNLSELISNHTNPAIYVAAPEVTSVEVLQTNAKVTSRGDGWMIETDQILPTMQHIAELATKQNWNLKELEIYHPSLEDVFLTLTGTSLRDE